MHQRYGHPVFCTAFRLQAGLAGWLPVAAVLTLALACGGGGGGGGGGEGAEAPAAAGATSAAQSQPAGGAPSPAPALADGAAARSAGEAADEGGAAAAGPLEPIALPLPEAANPFEGGFSAFTFPAAGTSSSNQQGGASSPFQADLLVVTMSSSRTKSGSGNTLEVWRRISAKGGTAAGYDPTTRTLQVRVPAGASAGNLARELNASGLGCIAARPARHKASPMPGAGRNKAPNDYGNWSSAGDRNWGLRFINMERAWDACVSGGSIPVGVNDSEIFPQDDLAFAQIIDARHGNDRVFHGTHVSGTIGALTDNGKGVAGVGWSVRLCGYDSASGDSSLEPEPGYAALARLGCRVINCSFGISLDPGNPDDVAWYNEEHVPWAKEFFGNLFAAYPDLLIVQAAGNDAQDARWAGDAAAVKDLWPDNIILVAACAKDGSAARFTNHGRIVDVAAPGVDVLSLVDGGMDYYSGTSMAAPHVTGLASLIWAASPDASAAQVKKRIVDGAVAGGRSISAGGRRIPIINAGKCFVQNRAPEAVAATVSVRNDETVAITLQGRDPDGDRLSFRIAGEPAHGRLEGTPPDLRFAPEKGYIGQDAFAFTVSDGKLESAPATVGITVTDGNDAPVATPLSVTTTRNTPVQVVLAGRDPDGDPLTFRLTSQPRHGTLSGNAPVLTYTPAHNYWGEDAFAFVAGDGRLESAEAPVSVAVAFRNAPPVVVLDRELVAIAGQSCLLSAAASSDADDDPLSFAWSLRGTDAPAFVADGPSCRFVAPAAGSAFTVAVAVTDGFATSRAECAVRVNRPPEEVPVAPRRVVRGAETILDALGFVRDPDGQALVVSWTAPEGLAVRRSGTRITFSAPVAAGRLDFRLVAFDGYQSIAVPVVVLVNAPPVAAAGEDRTVVHGNAASCRLDGTASADPDGDLLGPCLWTQAAGAPVQLSGNGLVATFAVPERPQVLTFRLSISDGLEFATDEVVITVANPDWNEPPVVALRSAIPASPGARVWLDASGSRDPEGAPLSFAWTQEDGLRVALSDPAGSCPDFTAPLTGGTLRFRVQVGDGRMRSSATTTVTVDGPVVAPSGPASAAIGAEVALDASTVQWGGAGTAMQWLQLRGRKVTMATPTLRHTIYRVPEGAEDGVACLARLSSGNAYYGGVHQLAVQVPGTPVWTVDEYQGQGAIATARAGILPGGNLLVAWKRTEEAILRLRHCTSDGLLAVSSELSLKNTYGGQLRDLAVCSTAGNTAVLAWNDGKRINLCQVLEGKVAGAPVSYMSTRGVFMGMSVADTDHDGFVLLWDEYPDASINAHQRWFRRFDAGARPIGPATTCAGMMALVLPAGGLVNAWWDPERDTAGLGAYGRIYGADDKPVGGDFRLVVADDGNEYPFGLAPNRHGGFDALVYQSSLAVPRTVRTLVREFYADGSPVDLEVERVGFRSNYVLARGDMSGSLVEQRDGQLFVSPGLMSAGTALAPVPDGAKALDLAVGPRGGLVAWSPSQGDLRLMRFDNSGTLRFPGEEFEPLTAPDAGPDLRLTPGERFTVAGTPSPARTWGLAGVRHRWIQSDGPALLPAAGVDGCVFSGTAPVLPCRLVFHLVADDGRFVASDRLEVRVESP